MLHGFGNGIMVETIPKTAVYCRKCDDENCLNCDRVLWTCQVCADDYRVEDGACVPDCQDKNCAECAESLENCTACRSGFAMSQKENTGRKKLRGQSNFRSQCLVCEVENCSVCDKDLSLCDTCDFGYELDNDSLHCNSNYEL